MPGAELARAELRAAAAALAFLTSVPVGRLAALDGADLGRGTVAFPLVGAAIGAATAEVGVALDGYLASPLAASVALVVAVLLTGGLHLDGLADTADGLGGRSAEEALAIMRDPRIGSYGVAAVALLLIVEASALAQLVSARRVAAITAAFTLSRSVPPLLGAVLPLARPGPGLARGLGSKHAGRAIAAGALGVAVVLALEPTRGWELIGGAAACTVAGAVFFRRRFGGVTGDLFGAAVVMSEVVCLVVASGT